MRTIVLIAAADRNWCIGKDNRLLYRIPEDMRHFRALTTGKTVIYGRKTLDSFPNGRPLPNRRNIVISSSLSSETPDLLVARSPEEALRAALETEETVFVCGGASVYSQLLPFCTAASITRIDAETADADARIPDLDRAEGWVLGMWSDWMQSETGIRYRYDVFFQKEPKSIQIPGV
ncbi:MAG: dihydrofolate reductase [Clostridia bacterium]|nr:dihydrofolate reductase [Clostridia bacterium]